MKIVTGYTGTPHVTSNAAQGFNQGVFGSGNCVLNVGNKFAATLTDANTVTVQDGEGILQGVHFRIDPGTTEAVTISNGTSGYKRIDLVCARYTKNAITGVENVSFAVVEGTPDASTPTTPTVNSGNVLTGSSPVDFPMFKVSLDGLTPSLETLFTTPKVIEDISNQIEAQNTNYVNRFSPSTHSGTQNGDSTTIGAGTFLVLVQARCTDTSDFNTTFTCTLTADGSTEDLITMTLTKTDWHFSESAIITMTDTTAYLKPKIVFNSGNPLMASMSIQVVRLK